MSFSDILDVRTERMKRLILPVAQPTSVPETFRGPRFVVGLYAFFVAFAGVAGVVLATAGPDDLTSVRLLGLVELQPTPLGLAVYGAVTVALVLGVPLALVVYVSRRVDADGRASGERRD